MKAPSQDIYTAEMGPQALSTCAQWKKESLKTKVTEDTDEKGSNNTNIGKVGKGAELPGPLQSTPLSKSPVFTNQEVLQTPSFYFFSFIFF